MTHTYRSEVNHSPVAGLQDVCEPHQCSMNHRAMHVEGRTCHNWQKHLVSTSCTASIVWMATRSRRLDLTDVPAGPNVQNLRCRIRTGALLLLQNLPRSSLSKSALVGQKTTAASRMDCSRSTRRRNFRKPPDKGLRQGGARRSSE